MDSVSGKVVLITGGAGILGICMVKELLNNGAKGVVIIDISEEAGQNAVKEMSAVFGNNKIIFVKTDVTIKEELEEAFEKTICTYKQLDIVINNAGFANEINWKRNVAVNLVAVVEGTYLAMQKYLPQHKSGEEGIIINTSSILGFQVVHFAPIYCTTKHALIGLGKALGGKEFYNKYKVRVLTFCPGVVDTPLNNNLDTGKLLPFDNIDEELNALNSIKQKPERVGKALIEMITRGNNGSLWIIEEDEPLYEVVTPHRKTMKAEER